jgi:hypothetical protein
MEAVQKQLNAALRVVLGVNISDKVSINDLHSRTSMLTFNKIAIQATQKLTWNIMSDKSKVSMAALRNPMKRMKES